MVFKLDVGSKEKTYHVETASEDFIGKKIGDKIPGKFIKEVKELEDYEFEITGASDRAGLPALKDVRGVGLKRVLMSYGTGMKKRARREGKKKRSNYRPKGLKLRKTVHGSTIDETIVQVNLKVVKTGSKALKEIFKKEEKKEEVKEEKKD
ncbi:MAG: 30S ribosomal protein S6e [archaeon]|nr:MAG: 30S ribosomal protein S6e [archaeon]